MATKEETLSKIKYLVQEYLNDVEPTMVTLAFKKEVDKPLLIETTYPIPNDTVCVFIYDILKDHPTDMNPKIKEMSREDFDNTFDILSYNYHELNYLLSSAIHYFNYHGFEFMNKTKYVGVVKKYLHLL